MEGYEQDRVRMHPSQSFDLFSGVIGNQELVKEERNRQVLAGTAQRTLSTTNKYKIREVLTH